MSGVDEVMVRIGAAVEQARDGDAAGARQRFARLWEEIGPAGDALHRCTLAHYAADAAPDAAEELRWDLLALAAADELTDERAEAHHASLAVAGFYPSLHLNLAEDYRRLGDPARAREHLARVAETVDRLGDGEYGRMIRAGYGRTSEALDGALDGAPDGPLEEG